MEFELLESDVLESLEDLGYKGPLLDDGALAQAVSRGASSPEFTKLCLVGPNEAEEFELEMSGLLAEMNCPYASLTSGDVTKRLPNQKNCLLLLTYLISELEAARMLCVNAPPKKAQEGGGSEVFQELKGICIALGMSKPPANITMFQFFSGIEKKLKETLAKVPPNHVGKPLLKKQLGPAHWYRFFGEPVVEACVENGASCIDICGEPQFLEGMYLKYNEKAAEKGVYVIGSCGFDSIPADMGVLYTRDKLKGTLTAVESFLKVKSGPEGSCAHDGTWKSAVYGLADQDNLRKLRKKIGYAPVPVVGAKLKSRYKKQDLCFTIRNSEYSIQFMGSDGSVVKRSQCYLHTELQETPVQYGAYMNIGGLGSVIKLMFAGILFLLLVKFSFGRKLLTKYPEFFSAGFFTKKGPTQKQVDGTSFTMTFFGEGYSEGQDPQYGKPNVKVCTEVKGPEPGYVATPIAMVQAAVSLLEDAACLPKQGGVYSPGAAFSKTKLIDRLSKRGVEFSVISKPEL